MKNSEVKVEVVIGVITSKDTISPEQIFQLNNFSATIM